MYLPFILLNDFDRFKNSFSTNDLTGKLNISLIILVVPYRNNKTFFVQHKAR